ncbi:hypothetical protein ACWD7Y_05190 [Streptomyces drozdowiczii]
MIAAILRYAALHAAAAVLAFAAVLFAVDGRLVPVVLCLVLAGACWETASYVRRAAYQLQDEHRQAQRQALAEPDPWPGWCCEAGFLTRGHAHADACTHTTY